MIFISYSSLDYVKAKIIRSVLESSGFPCWMAPESIPTGSDYATQIPQAIRKSKIFLLLLTENSQKSVWVPKELDLALTYEKAILPINLDNSKMTDAFSFRLSNVQRNVIIEDFSRDFDRIIERVSELYTETTDNSPSQHKVEETNCTDDVTFRVYLYTGSSTAHILTEKSAETGSTHYNFTENKWKEFASPIKRVMSILMGTDEGNIQLKRKSPLGLKKCISTGNFSFDDDYSVRFIVNSLTEVAKSGYDSVHLVVEGKGIVELSLFQKGGYVFHHVPDDTKISHFGIDEQALIQAVKDLVRVAENCPNIRMGDHFYTKVYSDKSGGYYLNYLTED